jgi:hypothetical protein
VSRRTSGYLARLVVLIAGLGAFALGGAVLAMPAGAVVPPPGTPDLSQMVVAPSDLAAGASATTDAYQDPTQPFVAAYERDFSLSATASGASFLGIISRINLAGDATQAIAFEAGAQAAFSSPKGKASFAHTLIKAFGKKAHVRRRSIHFGRIVSAGVGDASFLFPFSFRVRHLPFYADVVTLRVDRVIGALTLLSLPGTPIPQSDASNLAGAMAAHIRAGLVPQNTGAPTITGTAMQGQTLTATNGTWSNGPTSFSYQWQRCDAAGANCSPIGGATGQSYTVTASDAGATIRVAVTATNAAGSSKPATSGPTAVVH